MMNFQALGAVSDSKMNSGGLYYAAAVLAPPGYGPFAAVSLPQIGSVDALLIDLSGSPAGQTGWYR
jgi:hypothetical protein